MSAAEPACAALAQLSVEIDRDALRPLIDVDPTIVLLGILGFVASFAVQFVFPWELSHLGNASIFFIYACFGIVAFLLVGWLLPETKGKSLEELETILGARA